MISYVDYFSGSNTVPPSDFGYVRHNGLSAGPYELVWPESYSGTQLVLADITELDGSTGTVSVRLPPATGASVGRDFIIVNLSSGSYAVQDNAGGAVVTIAAGKTQYFYLTDNTTVAGVWRTYLYGSGVNSLDAGVLAGPGLKAVSTFLVTNNLYRTVSGDYTVIEADRARLVNVTAGTVTISLPQSSVVQDGFWVMIRNSGAGLVTVDGFGTEPVDGSLGKSLSPNESAIFVCNSAEWFSIGYGRSSEFVFSEYVIDAALGNATLTSADVSGRMLRVAGTATGNFTVTLPSIDNIYFVIVEGGMGSFTVTFKTAIGTGVTLTANQNVILYSDGTNTNLAVTVTAVSSVSLNDGTASSPSLRFFLDVDTGLFRPGNNELGVAAGGVESVRFSSLGLVGPVVFTPVGSISATTVAGAIAELDAEKVPRTGTTASAVIPAGTTAQRDGSPIDGYMRFNSTLLQFEGFYNGAWQSVGGGQLLGNAVTKAIFYNSQTIAENLTVATGTNGGTFGPVTINDGFTVTVSDGCVWSVV